MDKKLCIRFEQRNWPIMLLLVVCSSKWLFEDILGVSLLEPILLGIGFAMILMQRKFKIKKASIIWLFYIVSICMNLFYHGASLGVLGRAGIAIFTVSYILFLENDDFNLDKIINLIYYIGVFHAFMVLIHFLLREVFNNLYFPFLQSVSREYAVLYYRGGRYFGILTSPHEVAGLISFALIILSLRILIRNEKTIKNIILLCLLTITLFLTGKKGVMGITFVAGVIVFCILYANKRNFIKLLLGLIGLSVAVCTMLYLIDKFPDSPLFYRINQFIYRIKNDIDASSGRTALHKIAINLWKENKLMGIGWRGFKGLTTDVYGYDLGHQVNMDYLQWLCEMGIIGFIMNLVPIIITFGKNLYLSLVVVKRLPDINEKVYICFGIAVQYFILFYAFIEVPFYDIMYFAIYAVSCIIVNSVYSKRNKLLIENSKGN